MTTLLETLDPIFAECLGDEDGRYTLTKPWTCNGYVYATDGRIAVRQPISESDTTGYAKASPPGAGLLFDESRPTGKTIPLPDIGPELADSTVCEKCKGRKPKKCDTCQGSGRCTCSSCDDEHECATCNGHGARPLCSECCGEGTVSRQRVSVRLLPEHKAGLADFYVWLLQRHGIGTVRKASKGTAFCFRKGEIEGLVMGMALGDDDNE